MPIDYADYDRWKNWKEGDFLQVSAKAKSVFESIFHGLNLNKNMVLEVGFGNAEFLGWARSKGAKTYGTELNPTLRERAKRAGVRLFPSDLGRVSPEYDGCFDLLAAFDVMEHLSFEAGESLIEQAARLLKPGGKFVVRFPNAQSPFGNLYQYGDRTHVSSLSSDILIQLAARHPFKMVRSSNEPFVAFGGPARRALILAQKIVRIILEMTIRFAYGFRGDLGANTVVLMERTAGLNRQEAARDNDTRSG